MNRVPVLLAVTGQPFEEDLLAALERPGSRLRVARRCLDLVDLLAAASTRSAPVAVIWHELHRLDREALTRLSAHGVVALGVVDTADPAREAWLADLGMVGVAHAGVPGPAGAPPGAHPADASALVAELTGIVLAALPAGYLPASALAGYSGAPGAAHPPAAGAGPAQPPAGPRDPGGQDGAAGRLVAVWGPVGAPGRTTVAVTLADEFARLGRSALLADADTYGPSVAQRLGILDEASGLATAARAANTGQLDGDSLAAAARSVAGGLRVLTGLTRADRWPELPGSALAAVWRRCRLLADLVVVDCGFCLEEDDELAYDGLTLRRNGAALTTLAGADLLVLVGSADPVGLARLLRGVRELADLAERRPGGVPLNRRVVLTQVRSGPVGRSPARRVADALADMAGVQDPVLVPDDRPAHDLALATGRTLAEVAPRSPARAALLRLVQEIAVPRAGPWTARA